MNKTMKAGGTDRNSAMAMAAQLRLIAELLESGEMVSKSGRIMVNSNHSGDVTIESSLILSCQEQPKVERTTEPTAAQLAIYQSLQVMQVGELAHLNFDHDEQDNCDEWVSVIRNKGGYPPELNGYLFKVDVRKFASNINVQVERLV